ncbi:MAG: DUF1801 domain-containing protein [Chloroflexota bacterium]|nr:DUF1801 domain-containing protein [Chloroflexota bacterium]
MPTKESKADFDKLLSKYDLRIRALAKKTRALALGILPAAREKTYFGWSNTWYGTSEKTMDAVFTISPMKTYVQLFFLRGTELADPDGLLEGTVKKLRHVKIRNAAELKRAALRRLMKRAVVHGRKEESNARSKSRKSKAKRQK